MVVLIAWPGWVLCWYAAPLMVGRAVLVHALPHCWAAVLMCAPVMVERAVLMCCPPPWWDVLCWCLLAAVVVRGVVVFGLRCRRLLGCGCGCVLCLTGFMLCWCLPPPPLLGRAVFVRAPPVCGACCVGVFGFWFVVL